MPKIGLGINVLEAAQERIAFTFDYFDKVYVSFSAGKDSTVMLHLVMDEAVKFDKGNASAGKRVRVIVPDLIAKAKDVKAFTLGK